MIQLTEAGLICTSNIENLADIFSSDHVVRLPQLVKASVLKSIMRCVAAGEWRPFSHWEMSKELVLVDQAAVHALKFVANTPDFLKLIERVTGCGSIPISMGEFTGCITTQSTLTIGTTIVPMEGSLG